MALNDLCWLTVIGTSNFEPFGEMAVILKLINLSCAVDSFIGVNVNGTVTKG
jgi:hypothetical protein